MDPLTVFALVREGKISILKYMFENGLKNEIDHYLNAVVDGKTILLVAIQNNHYGLVKYLVEECGVDIEQTGTVSFDGESIEGGSPLWLSSALGNLPLVQLLVNNGCNINSTTKTKSSPLRAACYDGHLEVVRFLVEHGADIELTNRHGHTTLMIASFKGHREVVEYLLKCGADPNKRSIKGNTALHDCAETNGTEIFQVLLENNAKMTEDAYKITPLLTAALNACESIVHLIINYGVDQLTGKVDESKSLCTDIEKIHALELMGSTLVDKKRDICNGIYYWKLGFKRRLENIKRVTIGKDVKPGETVEMYQKKLAKKNAAYNRVEFNSLEELQQIIANVDDVRMQSLIIRERILQETRSDNTECVYYIRFRGAVYADSGDFETCIKLWLYALDKQQSKLDPLSPLTQSSLFSFAELFSFMMSNKPDLVSFEEVFSVFKRALFELKSDILILPKRAGQQNYNNSYKMKLLQRISSNELRDDDCLEDELIRDVVEENSELNDFMQSNPNANEQMMKGVMEDGLPNKSNENSDPKDDLESINFHRILIVLQLFIGLLCRLKPHMTSDQLFRFKKAVYQLVKLNPKGKNGHSLLHQASLKDESCQLIKFPLSGCDSNEIIALLLELGANVNEFDNSNNTPLHIVTKNRPNNSAVKIFLENGGHIDIRNIDGFTPLDFLISNSAFLNDNNIYPIKHLSLQCLCAQVIAKNNLSYKNILSKQVSDFVKIH